MNYNLVTPLLQKDIDQLKIYDTVTITGYFPHADPGYYGDHV